MQWVGLITPDSTRSFPMKGVGPPLRCACTHHREELAQVAATSFLPLPEHWTCTLALYWFPGCSTVARLALSPPKACHQGSAEAFGALRHLLSILASSSCFVLSSERSSAGLCAVLQEMKTWGMGTRSVASLRAQEALKPKRSDNSMLLGSQMEGPACQVSTVSERGMRSLR